MVYYIILQYYCITLHVDFIYIMCMYVYYTYIYTYYNTILCIYIYILGRCARTTDLHYEGFRQGVCVFPVAFRVFPPRGLCVSGGFPCVSANLLIFPPLMPGFPDKGDCKDWGTHGQEMSGSSVNQHCSNDNNAFHVSFACWLAARMPSVCAAPVLHADASLMLPGGAFLRSVG